MPFLAKAAPRSADPGHAGALDAWRSASTLVRDRWEQFKLAERPARPFMFAAYVAALDREEAAAAELSFLTFDRAA
jgi:hypothetical protein